MIGWIHGTILAALGATLPAGGSGGDWLEVALPAGFQLDLASGVVESRPPSDGGEAPAMASGAASVGASCIAFDGAQLVAGGELRRLDAVGAAERRVVRRGDGAAVGALAPRAGDELVFDGGPDGAWGYVRVLGARDGGLVLEYARAREGDAALERSPTRVAIAAKAEGLELTWPAEAGARWRIRRARVDPGGPRAKRFELQADVAEPRWLDRAVEPEAVFEYRVQRLDGAPFGASARGVLEPWGEDGSVSADRGSKLSLLTGRTDGRRVDVLVEFASPEGVQLAPGPGRSLQLLGPREEAEWSIPAPGPEGYPSPRMFSPVGRSLAVSMPEGIYARLTVEAGEGGAPRLAWRIDLAGGRVFPQPPELASSAFADGGAAFDFQPAPGVEPPPAILVERETQHGTGDFAGVLEGAPGATHLVDPSPGSSRIARYRFRFRTASGRTSPPSRPVAVLLADTSREDAIDALLGTAVADLGDPDFARRTEARAVLEHLGLRALPALRSALASEDPEVVGAAKDLVFAIEAPPGDGERPSSAGIVLRERASALGLLDGRGELATRDEALDAGDVRRLLSDAPLQRASALLGLLGRTGSAPEGELERWRSLVADADPDLGVRLVAVHWASLGREPQHRPLDSASALDDPASRSLDSIAAGARASLVLLGLADVLERGPGGRDERDEVDLALSLLERYRRSQESVFLEAADRLVADPGARVRAARAFADLASERRASRERRAVERLAAAAPAALESRLAELAALGEHDVDLVLPPGAYEWASGAEPLRISVPGLRLVGEGDVVLRGGVSVAGVEGVVLAGVTLEGSDRPPLSVSQTSVALEGCTVVGMNTCIHGGDALVELERCELRAGNARAAVTGVRLSGESVLVARETSFATQGTAVQGVRTAVLERCAIDAGRRNGIDGAQDGSLVILDCLIESETACLASVERGVLEGAVLVTAGQAVSGIGGGVAVCAEHAVASGPPGSLFQGKVLERCPLGRERR